MVVSKGQKLLEGAHGQTPCCLPLVAYGLTLARAKVVEAFWTARSTRAGCCRLLIVMRSMPG